MPKRMGSASKIHQHTASKMESASRIQQHTVPKMSLPLEFINQRGYTSRFHQPKRDPINQKGGPPLGTISMDLADQTYIFHFFQLKDYSFTNDLTPLHSATRRGQNARGGEGKKRRR